MVKFQWSSVCGKRFSVPKTRFMTTYVLILLDGSDDCVMYCDASRIGLGCMFMQRGKLIAYSSKHIKVHENNYPAHDLDLEEVVLHLRCRDISRIELNRCSYEP